jgi:hypothetical protein
MLSVLRYLHFFEGCLGNVEFFDLFWLVGQLYSAGPGFQFVSLAETDPAHFEGNAAKTHNISFTKLDCS